MNGYEPGASPLEIEIDFRLADLGQEFEEMLDLFKCLCPEHREYAREVGWALMRTIFAAGYVMSDDPELREFMKKLGYNKNRYTRSVRATKQTRRK